MRLLALLAPLVMFASCSKDSRTPLVVYSPHGEDILREFEQLFEAKHPDVDVQWFNLPSGDCLDRIRGERAHPNCDVWWGAAATTFAKAAADGLLEPYTPSYAAVLDADEHDAQWRYSAEFVLPYLFVFNANKLAAADAPNDWDDLGLPAWNDRIILRFPLKSGLKTVLAELVDWKAQGADAKPGFDWLAQLHRNTRRYVTDPSELFQTVTQDEKNVVTIWNLADALFQKERYQYPFGWKQPASGCPILLDCIALVKQVEPDEKRAAAARDYYEFVNSHEALRKLMAEHFRLPARGDVPAEIRPEWQRGLEIKRLPVDMARVAAHEDEWLRHWDEQIKPLDHGAEAKR